MCTGNFFEHASAVGNHEPRPPSGTRCAGPCFQEQGWWGASYCFTEDGNWGAECLPCPSNYFENANNFLLLSIHTYYAFKIISYCIDCRFKTITLHVGNREGMGNAVGPTKNQSSLAECIEYCQETQGCNSFTYSDGAKACSLHDKVLLGKPWADHDTRQSGSTTFYRSCDMGNIPKIGLTI